MFTGLATLNPNLQALLAGIFTWLITALGAACIFILKTVNQKVLDLMLGFAAGVMLAASFWSLLVPAIELAKGMYSIPWIPVGCGFLLGAIFLRIIDKILPHLHIGADIQDREGVATPWNKSILFFTAVTLHNIPEGLAVGVAFGAASSGISFATLASAIALAVGIGIQNFPEGFAVAVSVRREGLSRIKSFWYGQLSAVVEPVAAIIGASAVFWAKSLLPYAMAFAAGAMIFVVIEEVIPESQGNGHTDLATYGTIFGFFLMMLIDLAFG